MGGVRHDERVDEIPRRRVAPDRGEHLAARDIGGIAMALSMRGFLFGDIGTGGGDDAQPPAEELEASHAPLQSLDLLHGLVDDGGDLVDHVRIDLARTEALLQHRFEVAHLCQ